MAFPPAHAELVDTQAGEHVYLKLHCRIKADHGSLQLVLTPCCN